MDSRDFMRAIDLEPSRDATDAALEIALQWVGRNAVPERVFAEERLDLWATQHGYSKFNGSDLLVALRAIEPTLDHPSALASLAADLLYKYRAA